MNKEFSLKLIADKLSKRGFLPYITSDSKETLNLIKSIIPISYSVGIPGSVTIREMGLDVELKKMGYQVVDVWEKEDREGRLKQLNADVVLTSVNALSKDGFIVNLDGTGNRVSSMCFGSREVIAVVGINKIAENLEEAIYRVKNVAAPLNYQRKNSQTPCSITGKCQNCNNIDTKQCRVLVIHEGRPRGIETFHVILVKESWGF